MNTGMSDFYKRCFVNVLIFFVIFSIGFSFGKHSERSREKANNKDSGELHSENSFVKLYYMHAMFRCVTCNSIEEKAKRRELAIKLLEETDERRFWQTFSKDGAYTCGYLEAKFEGYLPLASVESIEVEKQHLSELLSWPEAQTFRHRIRVLQE